LAYIPDRQHAEAGEYAQMYFGLLTRAYSTIDWQQVTRAGEMLSTAAKAGKRIYSCGNGGSAAIANHLVCDCLKGARTDSTIAPEVVSLSATVELITAIANDIGVEEMFAYQVSSLGKPGDVLISISSSGASPNIVEALKRAKQMGMHTIAMSGFQGGASRSVADISLHVAAENYGVVEDAHQSLMHILAQYLRQAHIDDVSKLGKIKF
jgi:phosphoheptose isomerase